MGNKGSVPGEPGAGRRKSSRLRSSRRRSSKRGGKSPSEDAERVCSSRFPNHHVADVALCIRVPRSLPCPTSVRMDHVSMIVLHPIISGRLHPVFLQTASSGESSPRWDDDARRTATSPARMDGGDGGFHGHVTGSPEDVRINPMFGKDAADGEANADDDIFGASPQVRMSPPARVAASQVSGDIRWLTSQLAHAKPPLPPQKILEAASRRSVSTG